MPEAVDSGGGHASGIFTVLGVDTSLRSSGYGIVRRQGTCMKALRYGRIRIPQSKPHSVCLLAISEGVRMLIEEHRPDAVAIEGVFFCKNVRTALTLGQARGVVIASCAEKAVPVFEYAPRRVKQALVGYGQAHKSQVGRMVSTILGLSELPSEDETDALAIAICHLNTSDSEAGTKGSPL